MSKEASTASRFIFTGSILSKGISLLGSIALARLLAPDDYGYWLVVVVITNFFTLVVDVGFENHYMIAVTADTPEMERRRLENTIFFLRTLTNLILMGAQIVASYLLVDVYFSQPIDEILRILSIVYLISIFGKINEVRLKKAMDFKRITISKISGESISAVAKVLFAWSGLGVFSLAYGSVVNILIYSGLLAISGKFRPNLAMFSKKIAKGVLWYAKHSWIGGMGMYLSQQADKIFLKSFFPFSQLGFYSFANSYSMLLFNTVLMPQNSLFMTFMSNNRTDHKRIMDFLSGAARVVLLIVVPLQLPLLFFPEPLIRFVFGEKWLPAHQLFVVFLAGILCKSLLLPMLGGLTAIGRVDLNTKIVLLKSTVMVVGLALMGWISSDILSYAILFVSIDLAFDLVKVGMFLRSMNNLSIFFDPVYRFLIAPVVGILTLGFFSASGSTSIGFMTLGISLYFAVFVGVTVLFNHSALNVIRGILPKMRLNGLQGKTSN